jgi:hypothetical protein
VHARGGADNGGEKRNVLIVSVLLPIIIDLALRSKTCTLCTLPVHFHPLCTYCALAPAFARAPMVLVLCAGALAPLTSTPPVLIPCTRTLWAPTVHAHPLSLAGSPPCCPALARAWTPVLPRSCAHMPSTLARSRALMPSTLRSSRCLNRRIKLGSSSQPPCAGNASTRSPYDTASHRLTAFRWRTTMLQTRCTRDSLAYLSSYPGVR